MNRFDSHGGGWGYSGHSIEAVRFSADTDIMIGGYGLFGGRGEYTGKIKLFDLGIYFFSIHLYFIKTLTCKRVCST